MIEKIINKKLISRNFIIALHSADFENPQKRKNSKQALSKNFETLLSIVIQPVSIYSLLNSLFAIATFKAYIFFSQSTNHHQTLTINISTSVNPLEEYQEEENSLHF